MLSPIGELEIAIEKKQRLDMDRGAHESNGKHKQKVTELPFSAHFISNVFQT